MLKTFSISKFFCEKEILFNRCDEFKTGTITSIFGNSGKGKSTYLRILAGLLEESGGEIFFNEKKINSNEKLSFYSRNCFYISQAPFFFNDIKIKDYFNFYNIFNFDVNSIVDEFEMSNFYEFYPSELSGGLKYRFAIILSIISNKKILLYDEPTANLDLKISIKIVNFFEKKLKKERIIIIATHDLIFENYSDNKIFI